MYLRVPGIDDFLEPYRMSHHARRPLCEILAVPQLASLLDNQICRMLVYGDPRLPEAGFVAPADVEPIAADAAERLEALGFVGFMQRGEEVWRRLAELFDVRLQPAKANGTDELERPLAIPPGRELLTSETLELLERRTAADRLVYDRTLARAGVDAEERWRLAQVAFAHELVKLGDLVGESAARLAAVHEQEHAIERLQAAVQRREEDLVRLRSWLDAVHASRSWRLTAPLRAAKHRLHRSAYFLTPYRPIWRGVKR